jgi:hypothetical protein
LQQLDEFITTKLQPDIKVKNAADATAENDYNSKSQGIQKDCTELEDTLSVQHSMDKEIT